MRTTPTLAALLAAAALAATGSAAAAKPMTAIYTGTVSNAEYGDFDTPSENLSGAAFVLTFAYDPAIANIVESQRALGGLPGLSPVTSVTLQVGDRTISAVQNAPGTLSEDSGVFLSSFVAHYFDQTSGRPVNVPGHGTAVQHGYMSISLGALLDQEYFSLEENHYFTNLVTYSPSFFNIGTYCEGCANSEADSEFYGDFNVDSVRIQGVPEPGAWALMLLGFGGVGVALRRQVALSSTRA